MTTQLCQYGCGQPATHSTKGSVKAGPFGGKPIHQCANHRSACPAIKAKKVATSIAKFGTEYPWQTKEIRSKADQTNIEKYGSTCSAQGDAPKEKRRLTMLERYGVEQPTQNADIAAKVAAGVKQAYITDSGLADRQIATRKRIYGADYKSMVDKTRATQIANGRWVDPALRSEWFRYKSAVKHLTKQQYIAHKVLINPEDLPIGVCLYQVDHIYSIRHGFENNVDPAVIAHFANLRILWHVDNKSKHIRSDITLEDLLDKTKPA